MHNGLHSVCRRRGLGIGIALSITLWLLAFRFVVALSSPAGVCCEGRVFSEHDHPASRGGSPFSRPDEEMTPETGMEKGDPSGQGGDASHAVWNKIDQPAICRRPSVWVAACISPGD